MSYPVMIFGQPARFIPHAGFAVQLPWRTRVSHRPTLQIQELVAVAYGLHPSLMKAHDKRQPLAFVRQIAMYLTREITGRSLPEIGRAFGNRDHTTVLHALRVVAQRMADDPTVTADVNALAKALTK